MMFQYVFYDNLKALAEKGNCKDLRIYGYDVIDSDDHQVPIENVMELFPDVVSITLQVFNVNFL